VEPRIAINAANTPGDADSLFRITQPGSYYLTGNVTGVSAKSGIEIAADNVTIDLNGFDLAGVPGSLSGLSGASRWGTRLKNGNVHNWGSYGVNLGSFCTLSGVLSRNNASTGISVDLNAVMTECLSEGNGSYGFIANTGSIVTSCTSRNNAGDGFYLNSCTTTGCTSRVNGGNGYTVVGVGTIGACSGGSNNGIGLNAISTQYGTLITDCAFSSNNNDGISVSDNSTVRGCTLHNNGTGAAAGAGIRVTGRDCHIEGNHCTDNGRGILATSSGSLFIRNTCASNNTNWDIAANNLVGPIVDRTAAASAAILGNAGPGSLGSTDPNANFTY
jgi:parallel beta-helix repeat protein